MNTNMQYLENEQRYLESWGAQGESPLKIMRMDLEARIRADDKTWD